LADTNGSVVDGLGVREPDADVAYRATYVVDPHNVIQHVYVTNLNVGRNPSDTLRMNGIGAPGIEKVDFELFSLAVWAVNGCGMCLDAHEAELRKHGLATDQI
jgi:AhpD family alkylhydroperoxidase